MKKCEKCGYINQDTQNFCGQCGCQLGVNSDNPNQQQFPTQNGYYQPTQQPIVIQEKKKRGCFTNFLIFLGASVLIILFIALVIPKGSNSNNDSTSKNSTVSSSSSVNETTEKAKDGVYKLGNIELKYISSNIVKGEYDEDYYLVVNFEYTNNSDITTSFDSNITLKAFQSGVELQSPISTFGIPDYDFHNSQKEIKPGVTLAVQEAFRVDDRTNTVSIEIYNGRFIISDEPDYQFNIKINK